MHGWIILDKPSGITSAHAVGKVKRLLTKALRQQDNPTQKLKIGHAGTLDPLASGILPLALGEATKTVSYMMDAEKAYGFTVTWGEERDTHDSEGIMVENSPTRPSDSDINAILPLFTGPIQQIPPTYSAIKVDGQRSYDLARSGEAVELRAREVFIHDLICDQIDNKQNIRHETAFTCHCGKGTYIRSIARDMGRKLGCYGHISRLRRLKVGPFNELHAISLEMLENMVHKGDLGFLHPVESALDDILAHDIDADQAIQLKHGKVVILNEAPAGNILRARHNDKLVAICEVAGNSIKTLRGFNIN